MASSTGYFRIHNKKHWFSDVVMGAGIGILSTKLAYMAFPYINNEIFTRLKRADNCYTVIIKKIFTLLEKIDKFYMNN